MDATFETIGLEVPSEKAINFLAERAENQGEPTQLSRRGAVLHGRCWKLGQGLEVWTVLYESGTGDVFYANCRPGFRARYMQRITPWALTEYDEEGEAIVHGYCDGCDAEVLFELQNLTEVGAAGFRAARAARFRAAAGGAAPAVVPPPDRLDRRRGRAAAGRRGDHGRAADAPVLPGGDVRERHRAEPGADRCPEHQ